MKFIYNISIRVYALLVSIVSLWNPKAKKWREGRKDWRNVIKNGVEGLENIHWFHCASLGEFEQARPLIEKIKANNINSSILLTFYSPSGYEIQKNYKLADFICYLPLDTKKNAKDLLSLVSVEKAFFVKYEVWPNLFMELKKKEVLFYIISATFRDSQLYFKNSGKWFLKILQLPTLIFVQNEESKSLLETHNIESIVSGDTRYDRVIQNSKNVVSVPIIEEFTKGKFTVVGGSTWEKEELILAEFLNANYENAKLIVAPHEIGESHVTNLIQLFDKKIQIVRYSQIKEATDLEKANVIVIDNIGMLSNLYQYGSVAFIGGGFTNALHNILEPATFGIPVIYGSNAPKFPEAKEMANLGAGVEIETYQDFDNKIIGWMKDENELKKQSRLNKEFIQKRTGATDIIFNSTC